MQYRRANTPGATYFFTVVTDQRQNLFHTPETIACLHQAFRTVKSPKDWQYSSFHQYVKRGECDIGWGMGDKIVLRESIRYE